MIQKRALTLSCWSLTSDFHSPLLGTSTGDPTHDKVMWKRPDRQGRSGLKGLPWTCSSIYPETKVYLSTVYYIMPFTNSSDINILSLKKINLGL